MSSRMPTSINHLPAELHTSIFKFLFALECEPRIEYLTTRKRFRFERSSPPQPVPMKIFWKEKDIRSPSLFPFNVARVSKLWRDIIVLVLIPECWARVVFDVAKDPTPLLNAFLWSANLKNVDLEVVVFNSDNPQVVDKTRENSRVAAIAQALQPHIHRCRSIIFDVSYSTSLPPSTMFFLNNALHLEDLTLECNIDDIDLQSDARAMTANANPLHLTTSFPKLRKLSFTGFWFMYLAQLTNPKWLNQLGVDHYTFSLTISRFKFPKHGHYTLPNFVSYASGIRRVDSYFFHDLSLLYSYSDQKCDYVHKLSANIYFQSVSKDFLNHLHTVARIYAGEVLSYEACEIPEICQPQSGHCLTLKNVIDDDKGKSLYNILEAWIGSELTIDSCSSFDDAILCWLASETQYPPPIGSSDFPASMTTSVNNICNPIQQSGHSEEPHKRLPAAYMSSLLIAKCDNFSTEALKRLILIRNQLYLAEAERLADDDVDQSAMEHLNVTVSRGGPILTDDDKRWFQKCQELTTVYWTMLDGQGGTEVFSTQKSLYNFDEDEQ